MRINVVFGRGQVGVVTLELAQANEASGKLLKLVALSRRIAADAAFARQARRKYV